MNNRFKIKNVAINITDLEDSVKKILLKAQKRSPGYVCVTNVRATYIGNHEPDFCTILNRSFLTVPDGKPLEWYARISGVKNVKKTSGPDLFERICQLTERKNYTHFLYGSTPEVINRMQENLIKKYPGIKIVGAVSPPFGSARELANTDIVNTINRLKPNFVWVGLGAPKQERFMNLTIDQIDSSILIGVGLVFEYQAGTVIRAPKWMQNNGLEWLFRFIQQPSLSTRFLKPFGYFIGLLFLKLLSYGQ